jgi:hypothetical protein
MELYDFPVIGGAHLRRERARLVQQECARSGKDVPGQHTRCELRSSAPQHRRAGGGLPLFRFFSNSVGVANVADFGACLACAPAYVTRQRSAAGFVELVDCL